jgi:hypothetical protein
MSIAVEKRPLPRRDDKRKETNALLPHRGDKSRKPTAPLPRWSLEKCFSFYDCNCFGLELLSLIDHIRRISLCCI